jgi:CBS domain containing-hemolysin-like protein
MTGGDISSLVAIVVLLVIAGVLAAAEVGITRMSRVRALSLVDEERKGAADLLRITEQPARYLNVVLLLILVCHITATTLATSTAIRHGESYGEVIATVVMTILIFVFAEVSPKTFAVQHTDRVALRLSRLIYFLGHTPLLYGVASALIGVANTVMPGKGLRQGPFVTEEDLRQMADVAAEEASIEREESEMIHSIFEFGDTVVREVMVPRPDMVAVEKRTHPRDVLTLMLEHGFSRIPVYDENPDNIMGIVHAKDVMRRLHTDGKRPSTVKELVRKVMFVPESKKVAELLREMQHQKTHMAIVVDEYGDVAGVVTLEDLLEEIVGEIRDEYDREEPQVQPIDDRTVRVNGSLAIDEVSELLDTELPDTEWDTVGGLLAGLLGKVPAKGDVVEFQGLSFSVERVKGRRISKVLITKKEPEDSPRPEPA